MYSFIQFIFIFDSTGLWGLIKNEQYEPSSFHKFLQKSPKQIAISATIAITRITVEPQKSKYPTLRNEK